MIVVDTCVLIDVVDGDPRWADWSRAQLDLWSSRGSLIINPVVYAELSVGYASIDAVDRIVERAGLDLRELPRHALFLAGKAYALYRQRGGLRVGVLSDFFIGAHAAVLGLPVLTRDVMRYQGYFRNLKVVAPNLL
jgi:predicted nucleic acid-binding protein